MNWAQFKDPVCYLSLAGAVVASWSLTQEIAGLNSCTELILSNYFIVDLTTNDTNSSEIRLKQNKYG